MTPPLWQKVKRNQKASWESESGEWKSWLKAQDSENEDHGIWSHHFMQVDGKTVETVADFILGGSKITAHDGCSHEIKRCFVLGRKVMTNLDSILKSRDITLPTNVHLVKAMVFPAVMCGCESWSIKKAERQRIDAFGFFFLLLLYFFLIFIFTLFYFTILYWFCHTLTWIHHRCTCVPKHEPPSHLPQN